MDLDDLRYPIGRFTAPTAISSNQVRTWIDEIERLPAALGSTVSSLSAEQLETPYRPGGWRVRQVVHHLADSHMNSVVRFKLALTESRPIVKPYHEDLWAELPDSAETPIEASLELLRGLHRRWVCLLRQVDATDLGREFIHPEAGPMRLDTTVGLYAWHGRHHLAHITHLAKREGWTS